MNSKFLNRNIEFQMINQSNNFEDACSPDDIRGFVHPTSKSLPKVASWHSFLSAESDRSQTLSANVSPDITPQGSPDLIRKQLEINKMPITPDQINTKRWFNSHLLAPFSEGTLAKTSNRCDNQNNLVRKSNSYKNVSNFDINAIGPISF